MKETVLIIGLGGLGSSLGLALQDKKYHRLGWTRRKEVRESSLDKNIVDETSDELSALLAKADITIICLPIPQTIEFIQENIMNFKSNSIITDIGSVKKHIVDSANSAIKQRNDLEFIGAHPMAGTEKSGPDAALSNLYDNATLFITPEKINTKNAISKIKEVWQEINAKPVEISAEEHDDLVAHTSHISHIIASTLTQSVLNSDCDIQKKMRFDGSASGFRDASRVASSNPKMWRDIIEYNQGPILDVLKTFETNLTKYREIIESGDFDKFQELFKESKELRDNWLEYKSKNQNN